jgi:hypothetical protein
MSLNSPNSRRRGFVGIVGVAAVSTALVIAAGLPAASAVTPTHLTLGFAGSSVLTMPSTDGFKDSITLHVKSTTGPSATELTRQVSGGGGKVLISEKQIPLTELGTNDWEGDLTLDDSALHAGVWKAIVTENGVSKSAQFTIGSGIAKTAKVTTDRSTYFTNTEVAPYMIDVTIAVKDETGTYLPIKGGHLVFVDPKHHTSVFTINASDNGPKPKSSGNLIGVNGLPTGIAGLKASGMVGPGSAHKVASSVKHVTLAKATLESIKLSRTYPIMYRNLGGYHSSESFTFSSKVNTPVTVAMTGTITLKKGSHLVMSWPLDTTAKDTVMWNGLDQSNNFPGDGTYTVSVKAHIPGSNTKTAVTHFVVSDTHKHP